MMDDETVEIALEDEILVKNALGFSSLDRFLEFKKGASNGLLEFGEPFFHFIGLALAAANLKDAVKIINCWKNECVKSEMMWRFHCAKEKPLDDA